MDKVLKMHKDPKDDVADPSYDSARAVGEGAATPDVLGQAILGNLGKLKGMLGGAPAPESAPKGEPDRFGRTMGGNIRTDMPEERSQEGDNSDMMKYLPKKQPSMVPNSIQPAMPSQPEVYDAVDPSQEDPKMAARKRALMMLQGQ
jgi:hypothetical protein